MELIRTKVREYLGWEEIRGSREAVDFDEPRKALLAANIEAARRRIPDAIIQAYNVVVTVSAKDEVEAFRVNVNGTPTFEAIKADRRSRIQESPISPEALLPDGPYALWQRGEARRRASDIITAFAQFPRLPKMLRRQEIVDTLALGVERGYLVLSLTRPDKSVRTFWRTRPEPEVFGERDVEVVLPQSAELTEISPELLRPGEVPDLWPEDAEAIALGDVLSFFDGTRSVSVRREGYVESLPVPRANRAVVESAVAEAVQSGHVWLTADSASLFKEPVPAGLFAATCQLGRPPAPIPPTLLLPQNLPDAWRGEATTAATLADALSEHEGRRLPWATISAAIDDALRSRLLERLPDSGSWPSAAADAATVRLQVPVGVQPLAPTRRHVTEAEVTPAELQDVVDALPDVLKAAAGLELRLRLRVEVGREVELTPEQLAAINAALGKASEKLRL